MKNIELIAFEGEIFTLEWYYDPRGSSKALEYFKDLPIEQQKKTLNLFRLIGNRRTLFNEEKFRHEGDQIFAIKPAPDRFLCFFYEGSKIIITNAYHKKSDKMPLKEKELALKSKNDYTQRCKKGCYYE